MAYYGIPSAAQALTASVGNDTVEVANLGGTLVTAQSIYGGDGNDVISLGASRYHRHWLCILLWNLQCHWHSHW